MNPLTQLPFRLSFAVSEHNGSHRTGLVRAALMNEAMADKLQAAGAAWQLSLTATGTHTFALTAEVLKGPAKEAAFGLSLVDDSWSTDNFVLIPGAVYNGNRFHAQQYQYSPPPAGPSPQSSNRTPHIGDIPRLNIGTGPSHLDQMSIDAATPALAVYFPARKKALCLMTSQQNALGPFGYEVIESEDRKSAELLLMAPGMRHDRYFTISGYTEDSPDRAADLPEGTQAELPFQLHWFDCDSVQGLFDFIFAHRYDAMPPSPLRNELPLSATWDILHAKHNRENWRPEYGFYQVSINHDPPNPFMLFQSGWVGGMMTPYPMLQEGDAVSFERALTNLAFYLEGGAQSEFGLFHEYFFDGCWQSNIKMSYDAKGNGTIRVDPAKPWTLVRRIADVLFFLLREFQLLEARGHADAIKPEWKLAVRRNVEAVLDIWNRNGEFGQYINVQTGEVMIAGSTAAALIPGALLIASDYFKEPAWLATAEAIAHKLRREDLAQGVTTGGPGDCCQAPDSESIAALIESFVLLYERTGKTEWLTAAENAVVQTASWALSYDYDFPAESALGQIHAQSRGTFLANAQNKTGVPGICTLSGQSILRVFRATGKPVYLELLKEIAHNLPQYMGRDDKRIPTRLAWGRPGVTELPTGWICERVNVTQWGESIGEISAYSCWCEVAMMLTWCDLPGVYVQPDTGFLWVCDHIEAELKANAEGQTNLVLNNPTRFDARVKLMVETSAQAGLSLPINFAADLPELAVPAMTTLEVDLLRLL